MEEEGGEGIGGDRRRRERGWEEEGEGIGGGGRGDRRRERGSLRLTILSSLVSTASSF